LLQATLAGVGDELVQFVMVFGLAAAGAMALVDRVLLRSPLHGAGRRRVHRGPTRAGPS
jgi:hypothetical protein